jgi:hypothetical protein
MSQEFWYCLTHQTVEHGPGCPNGERMGPYETSAEAASAISRAAARSEQWDNDPKWNDD